MTATSAAPEATFRNEPAVRLVGDETDDDEYNDDDVDEISEEHRVELDVKHIIACSAMRSLNRCCSLRGSCPVRHVIRMMRLVTVASAVE